MFLCDVFDWNGAHAVGLLPHLMYGVWTAQWGRDLQLSGLQRSPAPSTLHYPVPDVPYQLDNRKETFMQSTVLSTVISRPSLHTGIRSVQS